MTFNGTYRKCLTYLWKLENISYCLQKKGERIESPKFVVSELDGTIWRLWLYPRGDRDGNYIGFYLCREANDECDHKVEIQYELAIIAKDGSDLVSKLSFPVDVLKGEAHGYAKFKELEDVFTSRRSIFLPQDTLTVRCRIWKNTGGMAISIRCTALTHIGVEKRSFIWYVKNFSTLEADEKCDYQIKSIEGDAPLMLVELSLTGELNSEKSIRFELFLQDLTIKFTFLKLFIENASGKREECNQLNVWFNDPTSCTPFTFCKTKEKLLEEKRLYLPEDTLSLVWEWVFSKGVVSEEPVEDKCGCIFIGTKFSDAKDAKSDKITLLKGLADNMKTLYDENFLSDVKIKTNTNEFPTHKFILSSCSPVFKAMFSRDMKEKHSNCVDIDDLSDDTISRMLLFIYTTRVEDLTLERASRLYRAADKYAILSLKNVCSAYMKRNLTPSNACEVLSLADLHADGDLKSTAQKFIVKHGKQMTNSEEFKVLMQTNGELAAETLCLLFK